MSIATYSELQSAVATWMNRTDLAAVVPDFIGLAEKRIKTLASVRLGEAEASLTAVVGSHFIALPSDFKGPVALWLADINPREELQQLLPQTLPVNATPNRPMYWAIDAGQIKFQCPANQAYPIIFRYESLFELSDSNATNPILTDYPDVYLFGALVEACGYVMDAERAAMWESRFQAAMQQLNHQERANNQHVPLRTEFGNISKRRFNVFRGY